MSTAHFSCLSIDSKEDKTMQLRKWYIYTDNINLYIFCDAEQNSHTIKGISSNPLHPAHDKQGFEEPSAVNK